MGYIRLPSPGIYTSMNVVSPSAQNINAANIAHGIVGRVRLPGGYGTSKTISSAGGAVIFNAGSVTWANVGTLVRFGVQDVDLATGLPDLSYDVSGDAVPGTVTINGATWNTIPMGTGSKVINHGQLIAIRMAMVTRGGTDSVQTHNSLLSLSGPGTQGFAAPLIPYGGNTSSGGVTSKDASRYIRLLLKFDDGTYGWIEGVRPYGSIQSTSPPDEITFNSGTTPDQYGALFRVQFKHKTDTLAFFQTSATAGAFEVGLYGTPLGTPTLLVPAVTVNNLELGTNGQQLSYYSIEEVELVPGVDYVAAIRPTSGSNMNFGYYDAKTGNGFLKAMYPFASLKMVSRTDNTGAFAEVQTYFIPILGLTITQLEEGSGPSPPVTPDFWCANTGMSSLTGGGDLGNVG